MKKIIFAVLTILLSTPVLAQQPADKIIGNWESIDVNPQLRFEIYESGGKYFGKLVWASNMYEADGKTPKKDSKNPNSVLQNRSRKDIVNVTNLKYDDREYTGGKLYNPDDGDTYSLKAKLKSADELEFRGYKGIAALGKTIKFKRIK